MQFLGVEFEEFFGVFRSKTKRIKANVTREVFFLEDTARSKDISGVDPSGQGTVEFEGSNDNGKEFKELRRDGADFIEVTNGRSNVLVVGLEEGGTQWVLQSQEDQELPTWQPVE